MNKSSNIHIVGLSGAEGTSLVHYFAKEGYVNVTAHDFCKEEDFIKSFHTFHAELTAKEKIELLKKTMELPMKFNFGEEYLKGISSADILFLPQSWFLYPDTKTKVLKAVEKGVKIKSMMQLYLELAKCTTIGVTGTNGKTTTTNIIYNILKSYKSNTYLVGNDRKNKQILEHINDIPNDSFLVLEISNRQLKMPMSKNPHIAVITNISQNHLNEHTSFEDYKETKLSIIRNQSSSDVAIINSHLKEEVSWLKSKKLFFSSTDMNSNIYLKDKFIIYKNNKFIDTQKLNISGPHNYENIMAAILVAKSLDVPDIVIQNSIYSFEAVSKRLEKIFEMDDKEFINDLSSTTPESTINAIKSFEGKDLTLIIGGDDKDLDYNDFIIKAPIYCNRILYKQGSVSDKVIPFLREKIDTIEFESIEECITKSIEKTQKNGVVLFSPMGECFISKILRNKKLSVLIEKFSHN